MSQAKSDVNLIFERNDFYKNGFRSVLLVAATLAAALAIALVIIVSLINRNQEPRYFQTNPAGQLVEMAPTNIPYVRVEQVLGFTETVGRKIFTLNFKDYRAQLEAVRENFTADGYDNYRQALQTSGMLDYIIQNRVISSVALEGPPVLIAEGIAGTVYGWKIQIPVLLTYDSGNKKTPPLRQLLTITVVRTPTWENPRGIAVSAVVVK